MTKTMTKKLLALLLALTMCFSLLPVSAYAGEPEGGTTPVGETQDPPGDAEDPGEPSGDDGDDEGEDCAHTSGEAVRENVIAPTCTEPGSHDEVVYCTLCGEELSRKSVTDPAAHTPGEAVRENVTAPTCTEPGSHDEVVYCTACGEELSRKSVTDPAAHTPGEAVRENVTAPTCTEPGSHDEVVYCMLCGEELSRKSVTDPAAHTPKDVEEVPPQVGVPGHKAGVVCAVCGETLEGCEELEALTEKDVTGGKKGKGASQLLGTGETSGTCGKTSNDNVTWIVSNNTLTISGQGDMEDYNPIDGKFAPWNLIDFTSVVIEEGVTSVGNNAFWGYHDLTSAVVAASVTRIGDYAFGPVRDLSSVTLKEGLQSIGEGAFMGLRNGDGGLLTEITIPRSVESIGKDAFLYRENLSEVNYGGTEAEWAALTAANNSNFGSGNEALTGATIAYALLGSGTCGLPDSNNGADVVWVLDADGVLTISGTGAMADYTAASLPWGDYREDILSVVIESGVTNIGDQAFYELPELVNAVIAGSVKSIGSNAFFKCEKLQSVTLAEGLESIGKDAFYGCTALTSVALPASLTEVDSTAFNNCTALKRFSVAEGSESFSTEGGVLFNKAGTALLCCPIGSNIVSYTVPAGVTSIGDRAFFQCKTLLSVTLPAGVTGIGGWAFQGCELLQSITIPAGVTSLGDAAFCDCERLSTVTLPRSVTSIGDAAFDGCTGLNAVTYGGTEAEWNALISSSGFGANNEALTSATVCFMLDAAGSCGKTGSDDVSWALDWNGVLTISGTGAMADYGNGANSNPPPWYAHKDKYLYVVIEEGVTYIGEYAFYDCDQFTDLTLPASLESIGDYAFSLCTALTDVYYGGTIAMWEALTDTFSSINQHLTTREIHISAYEIESTYGILVSVNGKPVTWAPVGATVTLSVETGCTLTENTLKVSYLLDGVSPTEVQPTQGTGNAAGTWTFTMPAGDVTITATVTSPWRELQTKLNAGGTIKLDEDVSAGSSDVALTVPADVSVELDLSGFMIDRNLPQDARVSEDGSGFRVSGSLSVTDSSSAKTGKITGGRADYGGGVYVASGGSFTLSGGTIIGSSASYGGGVCSYGSVTVDGGAVSGNSALIGGGVYIVEGSFSLSGAPVITGNTQDDGDESVASNVYLYYDQMISVTGTLSNTTPIGVTTLAVPTAEQPVVVTSGLKDKGGKANFTSDDDSFVAELNANLELMLAVPLHITLPADSELATVRITDVTGTPVTDEPPAYVLHDDVITLKVTPAAGVTLSDGCLRVSWTDENDTLQYAELTPVENEENAWYFFMPPQDVTVSLYFGEEDAPTALTLDREYLALKQGDTAQLSMSKLPAQWVPSIRWSSDDEAVAAVDQTGKVTAVAKGTAWITASLDTETGTLSARCRIDVTEGTISEALAGVRLVDTVATVELYKTDYTRIELLPELEQNMSFAQAAGADTAPVSSAGERGMAIESARFADGLTSTHFALRVIDDRTLEIVPREAFVTTNAAALKQLQPKYKSGIIVKVEGKEFTTGPLTLKLKRTLPSVTAKKVKLNSFLIGDEQAISFSTRVLAARVSSKPGWLSFDENKLSVTYTGPNDVGRTGKLKLLVKPAGWAVERPVSVEVKASKTEPKLSLNPASVTLRLNVDELVTTAAKVTPAAFADPDAWPITVVGVKEGKKDAGSALDVIADGRSISVRPGANAPTDGKEHTYKVTLAIARAGQASSVRKTLTVKLPSARTKIEMSAKASGFIDTALPESPITLKVKTTGLGTPLLTPDDITVLKEKKKTSEDVTDLFEIRQSGSKSFVLTEKTAGSLESGCTYRAVIAKNYGEQTVKCRVKLPVRFSTKLKRSVKLNVSGSVDVIRPSQAVTVKLTVKNCFTYKPDAADLHIWKKTGKSWTDVTASSPFNVAVKDGRFALTLKDNVGVNPKKDSFQVSLTATLDGVNVTTKMVPLRLKMGYAKITQSANAVELLKTDRNSRATVKLGTKDPAVSIDWARTEAAFVSPKDKKSKIRLFELEYLGGGEYAIGYRNSEITTNSTTSVKIPVYLVGNSDTKPNATIIVKVRFK